VGVRQLERQLLGGYVLHHSNKTFVFGIQVILWDLGYGPGPIDCQYGPLSKEALRDYQSAHGLKADGVAGPKTWLSLRSQLVVGTIGSGGVYYDVGFDQDRFVRHFTNWDIQYNHWGAFNGLWFSVFAGSATATCF
jgi:peptidoglycan hydrolase-like protein with peptidoglycan-binding domain